MKKCDASACVYCSEYKKCEKRKLSPCSCGNAHVAVLFRSLPPRRIFKKKAIHAFVICPDCKEQTREYSYEYQAVKAWNEMMRRHK